MNKCREYIEPFIFHDGDLDEQGLIRVGRLLQHFQDIASDHVSSEGCGVDEIKKDNYIWVLSKLKYKIYGELSKNRNYTISTCQRRKKAVTFLRDYFIYDEEGHTVLEGTSQWCVLNFVTRKVERVDFGVENIDHDSEYINDGFGRIHLNEKSKSGRYVIGEDDIDGNLHTNNCRYADFISMITGCSYYRDFSIYFSKETMEGDEILFLWEKQDDYLAIEGQLKDGTLVFQARMK